MMDDRSHQSAFLYRINVQLEGKELLAYWGTQIEENCIFCGAAGHRFQLCPAKASLDEVFKKAGKSSNWGKAKYESYYYPKFLADRPDLTKHLTEKWTKLENAEYSKLISPPIILNKRKYRS